VARLWRVRHPQRDGIRRSCLRQAHRGGGGLHGGRWGEVALPSRIDQGDGRLGLRPGHQPVRLPPLRPSAMGGPAAGNVNGPVGPALRAAPDVVGGVRRVAPVPLPVPVPAPARAACRRLPVPRARGGAALLRATSLSPRGRLQGRRLLPRGAPHARLGSRWPHRLPRRHELPRPRTARGRGDEPPTAREDRRACPRWSYRLRSTPESRHRPLGVAPE